MEETSVDRTLKQLSTANMKSKLKNLMAAGDGGMKREAHTKRVLGIMDIKSTMLTTLSSGMIFKSQKLDPN